jgi:hypothetical protein
MSRFSTSFLWSKGFRKTQPVTKRSYAKSKAVWLKQLGVEPSAGFFRLKAPPVAQQCRSPSHFSQTQIKTDPFSLVTTRDRVGLSFSHKTIILSTPHK